MGGGGRVPDAVCIDLSFYENFNSPGLLNGVQKSFKIVGPKEKQHFLYSTSCSKSGCHEN